MIGGDLELNKKQTKKIRQYVSRNAKGVFEAYRLRINSYPLKIRIKIALKIIAGKF